MILGIVGTTFPICGRLGIAVAFIVVKYPAIQIMN
jgi:hypothetical protein